MKHRITAICVGITSLLLGGCTTYGVIDNRPIEKPEHATGYSRGAWARLNPQDEVAIVASFSGGGTRAAALAFGVLQGLRDTNIEVGGETRRALDEVNYISSVSGGSFTAAYYGLHGDGIFDTFEDAFLLRDVEKHLFWELANPVEWMTPGGRTEMAIDYYNDTVFHGATFSDMKREGRPMIVINSSDLGRGVRFSFIQDYFDLICSDLDSYPVANAVAASSAVPLVFLPVVLKNYPDCIGGQPAWVTALKTKAKHNPRLAETVDGVETLLDKKSRHYIHMVDGGITDNLGLRALYDIVALSGGIDQSLHTMKRKPPKYFVVIAVNASTDPEPTMDLTNAEPSVSETINAMSDVQLHRYNVSTLQLMENTVHEWGEMLSTPEHPIKTYFIRVSLDDLREPQQRAFFNRIPTSFALSAEQVDRLTAAGRSLLLKNPEYQRLISDLGGSVKTP